MKRRTAKSEKATVIEGNSNLVDPGKRKRGRPKGTTKQNTAMTSTDTGAQAITITAVFEKNRAVDDHLIVVHRGGSRSSKSYSLIQEVCDRFFSFQGRKILVLRKTLPALRLTTYRDAKSYLQRINMWKYVHEEKQFLDWHYGDSYMHWGSLDDPEKIKSSEWHDIWMEEATEFDYRDYMILKTRLSGQPIKPIKNMRPPPHNQLFLSFNPENLYHWIKERVVDNKEEDVVEIHSSYKDNPFLPDSYVQQLKQLERQDPNFYRIYTLGEWGQLEALIFSNWTDVPRHIESENYIYGTDFGFNAPSTLVKIVYDESEMKMTVEELVYETNLTNAQFIRACKDCTPEDDWRNIPYYMDSAEPDRIQEFVNAGFNGIPTHKGTGSVKDGIDLVKRWQVGVLHNSPHISKERKSYSWKKDKNEHTLDEPVKWNDHALDAIRGGMYTHYLTVMGRSGGIRVIGGRSRSRSKWDFFDNMEDRLFQQRS